MSWMLRTPYLLDAIAGRATLYARADDVEAAWKFVGSYIECFWENSPQVNTYGYSAGPWGPRYSDDLWIKMAWLEESDTCYNEIGSGTLLTIP